MIREGRSIDAQGSVTSFIIWHLEPLSAFWGLWATSVTQAAQAEPSLFPVEAGSLVLAVPVPWQRGLGHRSMTCSAGQALWSSARNWELRGKEATLSRRSFWGSARVAAPASQGALVMCATRPSPGCLGVSWPMLVGAQSALSPTHQAILQRPHPIRHRFPRSGCVYAIQSPAPGQDRDGAREGRVSGTAAPCSV